MKIKLIITDIDGVWTDGGMYYDNTGNELKRFHTYDSAGILFCRLNAIKTAIITGEKTMIVAKRANKLQVDFLFQGIRNKYKIAEELCKRLEIKFENIAFIGDDLNDMDLLQAVGLSACPKSAPQYVKEKVNWVLTKNGGDGVYREFVEKILLDNKLLETTINNARKYIIAEYG